MKKAMFFTVDAIVASMILIVAIILLSQNNVRDISINDINHLAEDSINVLSTIKIIELNNTPIIQQLIADGNITEEDYNNSILEQITIFWGEGKNNIANNLTNTFFRDIVPDGYNYGIWAEDENLTTSNPTDFKTLISYKKFVSGVEEGRTIRGFISKIYFSTIESKRTNSYIHFGGYVGEGTITATLELPNNVTIREAEMEADFGNDFNITINGNYAGTYYKGMGGGGYMDADYWSLNSYKGYFKKGDNTVVIDFLTNDSNYIGGGYIKVTYDTPYKYAVDTTYNGSKAYTKRYLPGIDGIINLYDSIFIPGTLNSMNINLDFYSNYTAYFTLGNVTLHRNTTTGNHSITLNNTQIESMLQAQGVNYSQLSFSTIPFRLGLENVEYIGNTGATDSILVTDVSGSMDWESYVKSYTGSTSSLSYIKLGEINITAPEKIDLNYDADWNSGTTNNLTVNNDMITLEMSGASAAIVDDSQTDYSTYSTIYDSRVRVQTFTPSRSGDLLRVRLNIYRRRNPSNLVVEIRNVVGNEPGSTVLATESRSRNSFNNYAWNDYDFDFSSPTTVTAGTKYAIVIYQCCGGSGGSSNNYYAVRRDNSDEYSGGNYVYSSNFMSSWNQYSGDLFFETYIDGPGYTTYGNATYEHDAGKIVDYYEIDTVDDTPGSTSLTYEYRSSNDSSTWTSWTSSLASLPDSRYLQVMLQLYSSDSSYSPEINRLVVYYDDPNNLTNLFENYSFTRNEIRDYLYAEELLTQLYYYNYYDLQLISPSGITYGAGIDHSQFEGSASYYNDNNRRTILIEKMSIENGTWEAYARRTGTGSRNYYLDMEVWIPNRMEIAKFANKLASQIILNNSNNQIGLTTYHSYIRDELALTDNYTIAKATIESYYPSGSTCICCGINKARMMLPPNGTRNIIIMSDGDATMQCDGGYNDVTGNSGSDAYNDAIASGQYACTQGVRVFTIGFGSGISSTGTQTLKDTACNTSDYYNADNAEDLVEVFQVIANQILGISYTKQSVNITGNVDWSYLYPSSYIELNYTQTSNPSEFGDIFISTNTQKFNNTITNGTFYLPSNVRLVEAKVSSYSAEKWTSNVTINNGSHTQNVFKLSNYGPNYQLLGDPYLVGIPDANITRESDNIVNIHTGIGPENESSGSVDDRIFYTIVVKNFADSPTVSQTALGCKWELEFDDGSETNISIPNSYSGSKLCYYKNATYDLNDSIDTAAYQLFSQLDFKSNGKLIVRFDEDDLVAELSTVDNVPSMWGPSFTEVRMWK